MANPRNEENEYGEGDALKMAEMNSQPDEGNEDESPDMDEELNETDADRSVPGERQATRLPGDTLAERE